jgi:hypothetical protein
VNSEMKESKMLDGVLIDPWKQEISRIQISSDTDIWRKVLRCDYFDCMAISTSDGISMDLWFDDEGRMYDQPLPRFRLCRGDSVGGGWIDICGYGLFLSSNSQGETIGLQTNPVSLGRWIALAGLAFEVTEGNPRFKGHDTEFLEQKMRLIENELPGKIKILSEGVEGIKLVRVAEGEISIKPGDLVAEGTSLGDVLNQIVEHFMKEIDKEDSASGEGEASK